jgi:hypothetical protein
MEEAKNPKPKPEKKTPTGTRPRRKREYIPDEDELLEPVELETTRSGTFLNFEQSRVARFLFTEYTKTRGKTKLPRNFQMAIIYLFQIGIKCTNIFHYKALQNLPILGFVV